MVTDSVSSFPTFDSVLSSKTTRTTDLVNNEGKQSNLHQFEMLKCASGCMMLVLK